MLSKIGTWWLNQAWFPLALHEADWHLVEHFVWRFWGLQEYSLPSFKAPQTCNPRGKKNQQNVPGEKHRLRGNMVQTTAPDWQSGTWVLFLAPPLTCCVTSGHLYLLKTSVTPMELLLRYLTKVRLIWTLGDYHHLAENLIWVPELTKNGFRTHHPGRDEF